LGSSGSRQPLQSDMSMRIRIVQPPTVAQVDGIRVDCFRLGHVYEVSEYLGEVFLAEGWAEPTSLRERSLPPPPVPLYSKS
jgi:hypothetical protein